MPRIRFTVDPKLPSDLAHLPYRTGYEVELSEDSARRWLRRGVAIAVSPAAAPPLPGTVRIENPDDSTQFTDVERIVDLPGEAAAGEPAPEDVSLPVEAATAPARTRSARTAP